jgi:hypothetical protein
MCWRGPGQGRWSFWRGAGERAGNRWRAVPLAASEFALKRVFQSYNGQGCTGKRKPYLPPGLPTRISGLSKLSSFPFVSPTDGMMGCGLLA